MISAPVRPTHQRRCAARTDARAPQASPLGHAAQGAGRGPLRAAEAVAPAALARRATGSAGRFVWHALQRSAERVLEFARSPKFG
jgi:hypothetical protein